MYSPDLHTPDRPGTTYGPRLKLRNCRISPRKRMAGNNVAPPRIMPSVLYMGFPTTGEATSPNFADRVSDTLIIDGYRRDSLTYAGDIEEELAKCFAARLGISELRGVRPSTFPAYRGISAPADCSGALGPAAYNSPEIRNTPRSHLLVWLELRAAL